MCQSMVARTVGAHVLRRKTACTSMEVDCWTPTLARGTIMQELIPAQLLQPCGKYGRIILVSDVISKSRRSAQRKADFEFVTNEE